MARKEITLKELKELDKKSEKLQKEYYKVSREFTKKCLKYRLKELNEYKGKCFMLVGYDDLNDEDVTVYTKILNVYDGMDFNRKIKIVSVLELNIYEDSWDLRNTAHESSYAVSKTWIYDDRVISGSKAQPKEITKDEFYNVLNESIKDMIYKW